MAADTPENYLSVKRIGPVSGVPELYSVTLRNARQIYNPDYLFMSNLTKIHNMRLISSEEYALIFAHRNRKKPDKKFNAKKFLTNECVLYAPCSVSEARGTLMVIKDFFRKGLVVEGDVPSFSTGELWGDYPAYSETAHYRKINGGLAWKILEEARSFPRPDDLFCFYSVDQKGYSLLDDGILDWLLGDSIKPFMDTLAKHNLFRPAPLISYPTGPFVSDAIFLWNAFVCGQDSIKYSDPFYPFFTNARNHTYGDDIGLLAVPLLSKEEREAKRGGLSLAAGKEGSLSLAADSGLVSIAEGDA